MGEKGDKGPNGQKGMMGEMVSLSEETAINYTKLLWWYRDKMGLKETWE